jgi:N-acetylglucosamine-6-phosphate deacetylase
MDADLDCDLGAISDVLASHGVTSFMPTVLSADLNKMLRVIQALADAMDQDLAGAVPIGIHAEGPYLNPAKAGAQSAAHIHTVDLTEAHDLIAAGSGNMRIMTFAPELEDSTALIELMLENGVQPSMGHSAGNADDVMRAIEIGVRHCTHLFNGMPPLDQRHAGLTSVALTDDRLVTELTVDGVHVHPRMIDLATRSKPPGMLVGISDATQGAGLEDGTYHLGDDEVLIRNGVCCRVSDGKLAGSCLTLDQALRNLLRFSSLSEEAAVACYSQSAARSAGFSDRGEIRPGKRADITVVDRNWEVQLTVVNGHIAYDQRHVSR